MPLRSTQPRLSLSPHRPSLVSFVPFVDNPALRPTQPRLSLSPHRPSLVSFVPFVDNPAPTPHAAAPFPPRSPRRCARPLPRRTRPRALGADVALSPRRRLRPAGRGCAGRPSRSAGGARYDGVALRHGGGDLGRQPLAFAAAGRADVALGGGGVAPPYRPRGLRARGRN